MKRWFYQDWLRIETRLRTSIVEGISVFLSLFDDNPTVKRMFCPPKETYDPVQHRTAVTDGRFPPFADLIEQGAVCALNFPVSMNPGLGADDRHADEAGLSAGVLNRIPRWNAGLTVTGASRSSCATSTTSFATAGENDPTGDEKFFALSRQAKCIPIVATQSISSLRSTLSGESWRTLLADLSHEDLSGALG